MADIATTYVLTTPGPDITFNLGDVGDGTDKYWIQSIRGLDGPSIRAPVDNVPFGDGGIIHTFWKGPRRVVVDGIFLIESPEDCMERRNALWDDLHQALESILSPASGTLAWTPAGLSATTLTVFNEVPLEVGYTDNFMVSTFSFGLISAAADPS